MKLQLLATRLAPLLAVTLPRSTTGFVGGSLSSQRSSIASSWIAESFSFRRQGTLPRMSSSSSDGPSMTNIGKDQMEDILESLEQEGKESGYVVVDVRGEEEVAATGKLSPSVLTLPLPVILQLQVFQMDPDEFEEVCKFPKPDLDETLVFTCAAGIRSQHAAYAASQAGYSNIVNYMGGANEWFSPY